MHVTLHATCCVIESLVWIVCFGQIPFPRALERFSGGCLDCGAWAEPMRAQVIRGPVQRPLQRATFACGSVPDLRDSRRNAAQPAPLL